MNRIERLAQLEDDIGCLQVMLDRHRDLLRRIRAVHPATEAMIDGAGLLGPGEHPAAEGATVACR